MFHILYIDDEPDLLEICRIFLEDDGEFTVDTLSSARDAFDRIAATQYDAIVSDYQMPGTNGITLLQTLRSRGDTTPFIIFTGKGREEVVIEALNSGADFYIQKGGEPVSQFAELAHKIRHAILRRQSDIALKKREQDYRRLIEYANEAIYVVQDGFIRMANPRSAELTGYSEEVLLRQPFTDFVYPDDRPMLCDRFRKRISGETVPPRYSFRLIRSDGKIRWVELSVVLITWEDLPATLNFLTDITDRKLAEDALKESEERYRNFFRTSLCGVFITTPEGRYLDFNDVLMERLGCRSRKDMFGIDVASTYANPEDRESFLKVVADLGFVREYPIKFRSLDGSVIDSLVSLMPEKNPDGTVRAFIGTVRDIGNQLVAEKALRESEERCRRIFESFEDIYYQTDTDCRITVISPSIRTLTRWNEAELIGQPISVCFADPLAQTELLDEIARTGCVRDYEVLLMNRNGTYTPVSVSANRIFHADGSHAGFAGILRNITRRKQVEVALKESEEKFRSLVTYALEAILILDFTGAILFANDAAARTIELENGDALVGRCVMDFIAPESRDAVAEDFARVTLGNDGHLARYHAISARGRTLYLESIGKVITYGGQPADLVSFRDVTAQAPGKDTPGSNPGLRAPAT